MIRQITDCVDLLCIKATNIHESVQLRACERAITKIKTAIKTKIAKYRNEKNNNNNKKLCSTHKKWLVGLFVELYLVFFIHCCCFEVLEWMPNFNWKKKIGVEREKRKVEKINGKLFFFCLCCGSVWFLRKRMHDSHQAETHFSVKFDVLFLQ